MDDRFGSPAVVITNTVSTQATCNSNVSADTVGVKDWRSVRSKDQRSVFSRMNSNVRPAKSMGQRISSMRRRISSVRYQVSSMRQRMSQNGTWLMVIVGGFLHYSSKSVIFVTSFPWILFPNSWTRKTIICEVLTRGACVVNFTLAMVCIIHARSCSVDSVSAAVKCPPWPHFKSQILVCHSWLYIAIAFNIWLVVFACLSIICRLRRDVKANLLSFFGIYEQVSSEADAVTLYFLIGFMPAVFAGLSVRYLTRPTDYVLKCSSELSNSTFGLEFCIGDSCCRNECQETYFYEFVPFLVTNCIAGYKCTQYAASAWLAWFHLQEVTGIEVVRNQSSDSQMTNAMTIEDGLKQMGEQIRQSCRSSLERFRFRQSFSEFLSILSCKTPSATSDLIREELEKEDSLEEESPGGGCGVGQSEIWQNAQLENGTIGLDKAQAVENPLLLGNATNGEEHLLTKRKSEQCCGEAVADVTVS